MILDLFRLTSAVLAAGDRLVAPLGLTSARWQVLGAIVSAERPQPVAWLARDLGGNQRQRLPVAMRHLRNQPLAPRSAAIEPGHLRRHRGLVDEDKTRRLERRLPGLQLLACGGDVRPILLGRVQDFF